MSNYYAWGRRKGDTEWERVEMIDNGNWYNAVFPNGDGYYLDEIEIKRQLIEKLPDTHFGDVYSWGKINEIIDYLNEK